MEQIMEMVYLIKPLKFVSYFECFLFLTELTGQGSPRSIILVYSDFNNTNVDNLFFPASRHLAR